MRQTAVGVVIPIRLVGGLSAIGESHISKYLMLEKFAFAFEVDGSLRDLIVLETTIDDWETLYKELTTKGYDLSFECGDSDTFPRNVREIFGARGPDNPFPLLRLRLGANTLNTTFHCQDEIEFDLDPRDVSSQEEFLKLIDFMRVAGSLLKKDVLLTPEGRHDWTLMRYRHEQDDVVPN